jgi:hypothetical protein
MPLWFPGSVLAGAALPGRGRPRDLRAAPSLAGWFGRPRFVLEPLELLRRLAALVAAPGTQMTRYHGVFANRSKLRSHLSSRPPRLLPDGVESREPVAETAASSACPGEGEGSAETRSPARWRLSWAARERGSRATASVRPSRAADPVPPELKTGRSRGASVTPARRRESASPGGSTGGWATSPSSPFRRMCSPGSTAAPCSCRANA